MSDVNRDPIRWERSMTQDKDGQYVAYHDYAVLLESHDALRAEVARLRDFVREVNEAEVVGIQNRSYFRFDSVSQYRHDGTNRELIARPRRMEGV